MNQTNGELIMSGVCPFLKESCIKQKCVMFKEDMCLIFKFLGEDVPETGDLPLNAENTPKPDLSFIEKECQIPNEPEDPELIRNRTTEEIMKDIIDYAKKEYLDKGVPIPALICELYLFDNGKIELNQLSTAGTLKLELLQALVDRELEKIEREKKSNSSETNPLSHGRKQPNAEENRQEKENKSDQIIEQPEIINKNIQHEIVDAEKFEVPSFISDGTPESIAQKILESLDVRDNTQRSFLSSNPYKLFELFYLTNGLEEFTLPNEEQRKIRIAKSLVLEELMKREIDQKKHEQKAFSQGSETQEIVLQEEPEAIAKQALNFIHKEFPRMDLQYAASNFWEVFQQFRRTKEGQGRFSRETEEKLDKAFTQARILIQEEKTKSREQRLANEKDNVQSIASACASWAKTKDMKKIAKYEMRAFLMEQKLDLLDETQLDVHSLANIMLKSDLSSRKQKMS
ncbi:MAG: hypothetical protein NWE92_01705 [Candidatus Bathyarchaeota archaeon]|nr:hypothetical protein [Candidatus Bathyarchaeota archaeon]